MTPETELQLFFDTETSGFPSNKLPENHPDQAWAVQLAFILSDETRTYHEGSFIIDNNGRTIQPGAEGVHGISTDVCAVVGLKEIDVLMIFNQLMNRTGLLVCHNFLFDAKIMRMLMLRQGMEISMQQLMTMPNCCTMKESTNFCQLPSTRGGFKWPKLEELYEILFCEKLEGSHDALIDVRATRKCYYELKKRGVI